MRNIFLLFLTLWSSFYYGTAQKSTDIVEVYVEQDGHRQLLNNNTVKIRRAPFTLIFIFKQPAKYNGIYINTSYTPDYFNLYPSQEIPDFRYLPQKVMSEYKFNPNNELKIHSEFFQYFGYNPKRNWFKFNKIEKKGGYIIGYRKVENLDLAEEHRRIPVTQNRFPLYLFFTVLEKNPSGFVKHREVIRFKGKIKFR
jgi:hypothetical protein